MITSLTEIDDMRKEIESHELESTIIHNVMTTSKIMGLSDVEKYIMLSYYALKCLDETTKALEAQLKFGTKITLHFGEQK